ncbi:hypothetical protein L228DRAFT_264904 [Xylona heveae TC161]|uniref:Mitochondrial protein from FMP27-domain-containing protein n=1 Tax=Xylona heveae (strain CBS 132557 / TC161) TaxID=1328760 RepID=A0A165JQN4_XYLHT|nr:hypothetical protein L228DRAFT_264904 [Xylona heveae TC161]KZF26518.1 hypothetical protein L228DRAFT_264904 [Xylona heveae TC161]
MAAFSPTFVLGVCILLYLASFVVFAIVRIVTGVSIQRIGYFSLRRIAYTPRDGVQIELRGLGLVLHRPTFAQPTWLSVVLEELQVTIDLTALGGQSDGDAVLKQNAAFDNADGPSCAIDPSESHEASLRSAQAELRVNQVLKRLGEIKDKIKRLHRKLHLLRMVDLVATNSSCAIVDVGCVEVGNLTVAVETRSKMVERSRLFQHQRAPSKGQKPAEWMFSVRRVLFTPYGKESLEVLDHCTLNIYGLLYQHLDGLRDACIALKLGRVHIPYDDLVTCRNRYRRCRYAYRRSHGPEEMEEISLTDVMEEWNIPGSREEKIVQTVSESKEFASSILRGIEEIQFAVSFVGMSKSIRSLQPSGSPLRLNMAMKEVGIDLHRLDQGSPSHRMYFAPGDVAHQALVAAISISIGVDDGQGLPEKLVYIPMATTTIKTTLPSKSVQVEREKDVAERNRNILFANLIVTSPSIDLDPKHVPLIYALCQPRPQPVGVPPPQSRNHHLISRLLPKASVKISVHEPVVRVSLPPAAREKRGGDDFDLLISAISSVSFDLESIHSAEGELHYSLASTLRIASHQFYYQTAAGEKYDVLSMDSMDFKMQLSASPEIYVVASGHFQTLSVHFVRPEITAGVRQIVRQLRRDVRTEKMKARKTKSQPNFLRRLPPWLLHFSLQGSDFGLEVAGVDQEISENARGVAIQLESWTAEYKAQKDSTPSKRSTRRRTSSRSLHPDEVLVKPGASPLDPKRQRDPTNGRRLAFHVRGLEGFVVESIEAWEQDAFLSIPRFEVALTASADSMGPVFHINSHARFISLQYSLYRHYAIGVAAMVLRKVFFPKSKDRDGMRQSEQTPSDDHLKPAREASTAELAPESPPEFILVDIKAAFLQIKATMPADPPMLLQMYHLEMGRHRWSDSFLKARLIRLCAEAPKVKGTWARLFSLKNSRMDLRENREKQGSKTTKERSIDMSMDGIRLGVPHQLILHKVFDNFVNVTKAIEQLHHRFKTETNEYILEKHPQKPRRLPKISVRSKLLLFLLEDGAFEWKLGNIYRMGLIEQKQRQAREEAFKAKVKHLQDRDQQRSSSRFRPRAENQQSGEKDTAKDTEGRSRERGRSDPRSAFSSKKMRYNPEGTCGLSDTSRVTVKEAWYRLQQHNSASWKKRIDGAMQFQNRAMREIRQTFWGLDEVPNDVEDTERILAIPDRPGLMATLVHNLHILIDKPSFPLEEYPEFLHRVGKGMPRDMQYSLLLPMNVQISMGEVRSTLRDYPLPLLHVPGLRLDQSPRLPSLSLSTDFVIAEEFRDAESTRHVRVEIVPPEKVKPASNRRGFAIDVRRTVSPVKTYSDVNIDINTAYATKITWGTSYQPAIQDMMMTIEGFTKPQIDPSDRVGFWDKLRLNTHSRIKVNWKGDGDVHLMLKGSRDPYVVTGHGTGFVMCWRNDVKWNIAQDEDPRKFMTVDSGEYVLAIPDFSHHARQALEYSGHDSESVSSDSSHKNRALFRKVIMKLSGNVRWLAGLVFEQNLENGQRSFEFKPHYDVILKNPEFAKAPEGQVYDAMRGFRSHHLHLSIAVVAPLDRDWSVNNLKPSSSYNTVHLSPRFFTHFFNWWSLFSGAMSLPIRQGKLWPGIDKSSKKFGRHLATIKYNLLLSPLFISHIYKHKDAEDYSEDAVAATGLKLRLDSFMLDLHQRREEFAPKAKGRKKGPKTSGMRINQAQLDFIAADFRAVSANITGTRQEDLKHATEETLASYQELVPSVDMSRFQIPDNDFSWIDMDDFVELDWILPAEANPETKIMPLAFTPRFTYFRQTDHLGSGSEDTTRFSPFGNEPTHYCVMSNENDPRRVQCDLIKERLENIDQQMESNQRSMGEMELRVIRDEKRNDADAHHELRTLQEHDQELRSRREFLKGLLGRHQQILKANTAVNGNSTTDEAGSNSDADPTSGSTNDTSDAADANLEQEPLSEYASDFNNRFLIHNIQLKWNNPLRDIIMRYIHQVSQRRGFVYYMSRKAVKFIIDIVEEQNRAKENGVKPSNASNVSSNPQCPNCNVDEEDAASIEDRIQQLLDDANKFVDADDPESHEAGRKPSADDADEISKEFTSQNSYHIRLVAPQVQLQSDKNTNAAVLVTAKSMQLKVVQIMDKDRVTDNISGLVQRRFKADAEAVQFFVTLQKDFSTLNLHMYSGRRYGTTPSSFWPPWVPLEVMFDFRSNPYGFSRVVQKTSASLRYEKFNTLRLKYNDEVSKGQLGRGDMPEQLQSRLDHLWIEFPHIRAICDSSQYYAIYIIVLDLLLYSEPLEKVRSERLEKIMLASDFSDLRGAPELIICLQERIRRLEEIKLHFQLNARYLDRQGWQDRVALEQDLTNCEDELFFMMKAITTSQRRTEGFQDNETNTLLRWNLSATEIVWHLMREQNEPLMEFQLKNAAYDRMDNSDGSNYNSVEVGEILGLNLLPDAVYPEMIGPYFDESAKAFAEGREAKMLRVYWYMLEAIAGIPVMDQFEVNLFPMKIQLEREVGKRLFEYIFPGVGSNAFDNGNFSPFMVKHMQPVTEEKEDFQRHASGDSIEPSTSGVNGQDNHDGDSSDQKTDSSSLAVRLKPTLTLPDRRPRSSHKQTGPAGGAHHFRLFQHQDKSQSGTRLPIPRSINKQSSTDSLRKAFKKPERSMTNNSTHNANGSAERPKRFPLQRNHSNEKQAREKRRASDDLSQMMARASNYMTLAYVKIPSVVLCLSYKGRGERNIEDVHDFVFRLPTIEYRNKTWSNLDLALHLKKDVIRALISHTGAIIGNKLSHHRPNKVQQNRLRELVSSSVMLPLPDHGQGGSDSSSMREGDDRDLSPNPSGSRPALMNRSESFASTTSAGGRSSVFASEPPSAPGSIMEDDEHEQPDHHHHHKSPSFSTPLGRHITTLSQLARQRGLPPEESEESFRRKGKLLLGKKLLGNSE